MVELFRIPKAVYQSLSEEEVHATFADMQELGIAEPPFPEFDIELQANAILHLVNDKGEKVFPGIDDSRTMIFHYREGDKFTCTYNFRKRHIDFIESLEGVAKEYGPGPKAEQVRGNVEMVHYVADALREAFIVLLATRNVTKERKENKMGSLGIGKAKGYRWITTIRIGAVTESVSEGTSNGTKRRPHLRRGHIRNQRYGPGFEFSKKVFIQPTFINADETFVSNRTAYHMIGLPTTEGSKA